MGGYTVLAMTGSTKGSEWLPQARRGILELCILSLLSAGPRYGYELLSALDHWPVLSANEGTLYPLLRRLQRAGHLSPTWLESVSGPPRKYYSLTPSGTALLRQMSADWLELALAVAEVLPHEERKHA